MRSWCRHAPYAALLGLFAGATAALDGCSGEETTAAAGGAGATAAGGTAPSGGGGATSTGGSALGGGGTATGSGGGNGGTAAVGLGIEGSAFTIDGIPTFLLGVSYFDGRNWRADDLDGLAARRFNLIRIWLDWAAQSFFDASGQLVAGSTLVELVRACADRGIVVDVTILDTELSLTDPTAAVTGAVAALANEDNVLFDLVNEHDHAGDTFSHADVTALATAARGVDPNALLTVSSQGGHIVDDLTLQPANIDEELAAGIDLLAPHFTRTTDFYDKTDQRVTLVRDYLGTIGRHVPVYLQEEARRGHSGLDPTVTEFLQAAREARDSGAAGWILHTDAGFDLTTASFFDSLDSEELATVDALGDEIFGPE